MDNKNNFEVYKKETLKLIEKMDEKDTEFLKSVYTIMYIRDEKKRNKKNK